MLTGAVKIRSLTSWTGIAVIKNHSQFMLASRRNELQFDGRTSRRGVLDLSKMGLNYRPIRNRSASNPESWPVYSCMKRDSFNLSHCLSYSFSNPVRQIGPSVANGPAA